MGIKSTSTSTIKSDNVYYKVGKVIFPSRLIYSTIASIDRNLRFLYSPTPPDKIWRTIQYSSARDDSEEFDAILDRVEERINIFKLNNENIEDNEINLINGKVKIVELDDAAFNSLFMGIIDFLYEASDYEDKSEDELTKKTPKHIKKRFINLANRLWDLGIHPSEF